MSERDKCPTCKGKGYIIPDEPWNLTLQEHEICPDCDTKAKDSPKSLVGLIT